MKKNMQTILIIIFIAIILATLFFLVLSKKCVTYSDSAGNKNGGCFYIWQEGWWSGLDFSNSDKSTVIETKTFSEIPGFSFEYPVFNGWEVKSIEKVGESIYLIWLNWPETILFDTAPGIKIIKENRPAQIDLTKLGINPNKVKYTYNKEEGKIFFYGASFTASISPFIYEGNGYSGKILVEKIIGTFKFDQ